MPHDESGGGGGGWLGWVGRWWRALVCEAVGTALLVCLGLGAMFPQSTAPPLTHVALAFGGVVTALAAALGPVSGAHLNPAVTLAALVYGKIEAGAAAAYVIAQIIGAYIGFGFLALVVPLEGCAAVTGPARGVGAGGAAAVEGVMTGVLALVICGAWADHERDPARPDRTVPLKVGLTVAGLIYSGAKLTGASLNPVRSLAPAHFRGCWAAHWVYWAGPLGGAGLAAALHRWVLAPLPAPRRARPEDLPLHDKTDH